MARARNVKPSFFKNDVLAQCSPHARLLFVGLWCLADREGRLEDRPVRIKGELFPYENLDIHALLDELVQARFIQRYAVSETGYIQVLTFASHQNPHVKEPASTIPAPDSPGVVTGLTLVATGSGPADSLFLDSPSRIPDSGFMVNSVDRFPEFWKAYPKKVKKKSALKIWKARKLDAFAETILEDIKTRLAEDARWRKDGGAYIPDPTTYLNQDRWEDEITAPQQRKRA